MPLIAREVKETNIAINVRLESGLAARLKDYADYLESTQNHVVSEAVKYVIDRDKEFATWVALERSAVVERVKSQERKQRGSVVSDAPSIPHQKSVVA